MKLKKLLATTALSVLATGALAQDFPHKTIELVIHSGAGGGTDMNARALATPLAKILDTDIVVVGKVGSAGAVAMEYINSRPADGYTLAMITIGHAGSIARGRTAMDADDFIYLGRGTSEPQVLYSKCGRYESAEAFIDDQQESSLAYGITSVGGVDDITAFSLTEAAGVQPPRAVPFSSGGEVVTNTIAGNIDVAVLNPGEAQTQVETGEICPVLVVAPERHSAYPDIPTARELGIDASFPTVRGFAVKVGTPDDVVAMLQDALAEAMATDGYRAFLEQNGLDYETSVGDGQEWEEEFTDLVGNMREAMTELGYIQ